MVIVIQWHNAMIQCIHAMTQYNIRLCSSQHYQAGRGRSQSLSLVSPHWDPPRHGQQGRPLRWDRVRGDQRGYRWGLRPALIGRIRSDTGLWLVGIMMVLIIAIWCHKDTCKGTRSPLLGVFLVCRCGTKFIKHLIPIVRLVCRSLL